MTVEELMEALKSMPPEAIVSTAGPLDASSRTIASVERAGAHVVLRLRGLE